jgi:hypothetical protein
VRIILRIIGAAADRVGLPDMVATAAFGHLIAVGHDPWAWRNSFDAP